MRHYKISILFILAAALLTACVSPMGMTQSTTPLEGRTYETLGKGSGSSSAFSVLGLWQVNRTDIDEAIREAIRQEKKGALVKEAAQKKKGDALINVTWQERTFWFILIGWHRLEVKGEVIRFTDKDEAKKPVKKRGR